VVILIVLEKLKNFIKLDENILKDIARSRVNVSNAYISKVIKKDPRYIDEKTK